MTFLEGVFIFSIDRSGELYVVDGAERRIAVLDAQLSESGSLRAAAMQSPVGLAVDGAGRLYVADAGAGAVLLLEPTSGVLLATVPFPYRRQTDPPACPTSVEVPPRLSKSGKTI
jgi:sugar lactone lactonase YvrE